MGWVSMGMSTGSCIPLMTLKRRSGVSWKPILDDLAIHSIHGYQWSPYNVVLTHHGRGKATYVEKQMEIGATNQSSQLASSESSA